MQMTLNKSSSGNRKYAAFETLLLRKKDALGQRLIQRLGDVSAHIEPEDDAGMAVRSFSADLAVTTLERERQELAEIESALEKIRASRYGICESCGSPIREGRLKALPWARLCIRCAARAADTDVAAD